MVEVTGLKLRTSEDAQLLRQALPHADAQRFARRDLPYMEASVCSLVDALNPKREAQGLIRFSPAALSTALMLAELYHLDTWKVSGPERCRVWACGCTFHASMSTL